MQHSNAMKAKTSLQAPLGFQMKLRTSQLHRGMCKQYSLLERGVTS